jgi:hypothetical protein
VLRSLIERTDACLYAARRHDCDRFICETNPEVAAGGASHVA